MAHSFANLNALLVDDYESIREKLKKDLVALGMTVTTAANGVEALAALREKKFDILFTDIVMPEMDGFELCQEVRQIPAVRDIPIVVTSTHCDSDYVMKALRLGADDYLSKPIDPALLRTVIARALTPTVSKGAS